MAERKYFVLHLGDKDFRPNELAEFEVQILDTQGRASKSVYFCESDRLLSAECDSLPSLVIDAAMRQPKGIGEYVNEAGDRINPF